MMILSTLQFNNNILNLGEPEMINNHSNIRLDNDQHQALQAMLSGRNIFLSGEAGTGKSVVIREFERLSDKQIVKLAPTGIAARNIGGQTLHSFFKLRPGVQEQGQVFTGSMKLYELLRAVEVIICDEISMVRSDLFQAMDSILRDIEHTDMPFGGKQIIVVGDFCQLPPVVEDHNIERYLRSVFGGVYAFQSQAWRDADLEMVMLKTIHRQDDMDFIDLLDYVRHGISSYWGTRVIIEKFMGEDFTMYDRFSVFDEINEQCRPPKSFNTRDADIGFDTDFLEAETIAVCCTRKNAQLINQMCMDKLDDPGIYCQAIKEGYYPYDEFPTDNNLNIKLGERVMFLTNQPNGDNYQYVNGDTGTVVDYCNDSLNPKVTVKLDNGRIVEVGRVPWDHLEYKVEYEDNEEPCIIQEVTGTFWQLPLMPAYAITIHKAQGQTIDKMRLVLDRGCFAEGQLYTALSRVRSMDDLILDRPIHESDLIFDYDVHELYGYDIPDDRD